MIALVRRAVDLLTLAALALLFMLTVAPAAEAPRLRQHVVVETGFVTLGDLFENAGEAAPTRVFRAPDPGETGHVSAARIAEAADRHGLVWRDSGLIGRVTVRRTSRIVGLETIAGAIRDAALARFALEPDGTLSVELAAQSRPLHLPVEAGGAVRVVRLDLDPYSGQFSADLEPVSGLPAQRISYSGRIVEMVRVPVLERDLRRGEVIAAGDVRLRDMPRREVQRDAIREAAELVGMALRRSLRADSPLRAGDLEPPRLVQRNGMVTLTYRNGPLIITMRGRSLDDGAKGDVVRVLNLRSKRTVEGTVTGADAVAATPGLPPRTAMLSGEVARPR